MNKQQAKELIENTFTKKFDLEQFKYFISNLVKKYDDSKERGWNTVQIYKDFKKYIAAHKRVGVYKDPNGEEIEILIVETREFPQLERARTSLRNYVVKWLQSEDNKERSRDYALVAFYAKEDQGADWRFSFVKVEQEAAKNEKGKVTLKSVLSPAKRYSYLVGQHEHSYTAQKQLLPLLERDYANPTIAELEAAFSVEKVTDEFFEQYKELFLKLSEHLQRDPSVQAILSHANLDVIRFTKKLLGQIVFLYFVQKKGWLGVPVAAAWGKGNRRFLSDLFMETVGQGKNFYSEALQYLFYEALAQRRADSIYPRFNCKIPFLNGGLFEADYDWRNQPLTLPDDLFRNQEKNKAGDIGTGILDVFDRYNFTIKEDEPLEKEVAVDPEMLGKVFENMLEIAERKSKGAFYTPREIVHYMCQESLIHYLDNALNGQPATYRELGSPQIGFLSNAEHGGQLLFTEEEPAIRVPKADLEELIRNGHLRLENDQRVLDWGKETDTYEYQLPASVRENASAIDEALRTIKVCDPAIGSAAFPVGLLHEIVNARLLLQAFTGKQEKAYDLKRHAILESIYGVDIDASAIDIARLRLWLSLIVDEDNFESIDALPNLDYKIVRGNSLIGFPDKWSSPGLDEIEVLQRAFATESSHDKKQQLKAQIDDQIRKRLANSQKAFGYQIDFDFRLWFSEVWRGRNGFDLIIGNPPYVQIQNFSGQPIQKDLEKQKYDSFAKTGDIYCLFYEKGYRLLHEQGVLTFITSNKWMRAAYGEKLRQFLGKYTAIEQIIDFGDSPIFSEATTYTNILIFHKGNKAVQPKAWDLSATYRKATSLLQMLEEHPPGAPIFADDAFVIVPPAFAAIKQRIEKVGTPLKEWDVAINYGIKTGFNDAFIIDGKKKDELIAQDPKSAEVIKPILRGRDIKRYRAEFADLWLLFIPWHFPLHKDTSISGASEKAELAFQKEYPIIYQHLSQYKDELCKRNQAETGIRYEWYALQRCAATYYEEFDKEKIIWLEMSPSPNFTFDANTVFVLNTAYILTGKDFKYLLAVLNSSTLDSYFPLISTDIRGNTRRYIKQYVENLPIPKISLENQTRFEILVNYILQIKQDEQKLQSAYFEQLIDGLVYELYFPEEIKAAGKELLPHLGTLSPIDDSMSDEAKLAIIQSEFERLYDPRHPVRNHLETLDSVEVVRIIQESLK